MGTMPPGLAAYMAKKKEGEVSPGIAQAAAMRVADTAKPLAAPAKSGKKFAPKKGTMPPGLAAYMAKKGGK